MSKDQALGALIFVPCVAITTAYTIAPFWSALEAIRLWLVASLLIAFIAVLDIGAWIGWAMATATPPKPIEETKPSKRYCFQTSSTCFFSKPRNSS